MSRNAYREGTVEHEAVRLLQNINNFLEGKTVIRDSVVNGRNAWQVIRLDEGE